MVGAIPMANTLPDTPHSSYLRLCFVGGAFSSAARELPAAEVPVAPFPGGNSTTPTTGFVWAAWNQNPERGACSNRPEGCVAK